MITGLPSLVEERITRLLSTETPSTAQLLKKPLGHRKPLQMKRSRSADSIYDYRGNLQPKSYHGPGSSS